MRSLAAIGAVLPMEIDLQAFGAAVFRRIARAISTAVRSKRRDSSGRSGQWKHIGELSPRPRAIDDHISHQFREIAARPERPRKNQLPQSRYHPAMR